MTTQSTHSSDNGGFFRWFIRLLIIRPLSYIFKPVKILALADVIEKIHEPAHETEAWVLALNSLDHQATPHDLPAYNVPCRHPEVFRIVLELGASKKKGFIEVPKNVYEAFRVGERAEVTFSSKLPFMMIRFKEIRKHHGT